MPWFKVDDELHGHPKPRRAGLAAYGLWTVSGAYSMAYKTDGFVPDWYVKSWPQGSRLADALVRVGSWFAGHQGGEPGWFFHDWSDYQPSSDEIEADREKARNRQRQWRARKRGETESHERQTPPVTRDTTVNETRESPSPVPTRPSSSSKNNAQTEDWNRFWNLYPKKVNKKRAYERWVKATKLASPEIIIAGLERYVAELNKPENSWLQAKDPDGWLNGERWNDEPSNVRQFRTEPKPIAYETPPAADPDSLPW